MYVNVNDFELLYLIKEGNSYAYKFIFKKYEHLICKIYYDNKLLQKIPYCDFLQEGYMCLDKAIKTYSDKYECIFYSYFLIILKRRSMRLIQNGGLYLKESSTVYQDERFFKSKKYKYILIDSLKKDLNLKDDIDKDLFNECILNNAKVITIAEKYNMDYGIVYFKYKKIKAKIEKILTNIVV